MYFDAQISGNTIVIKSDTFWNCTVYGSIILSEYSGENNATLEMSFKNDMQFCSGKIIFSYGDGKCDYPSIDVYLTNNCWIITEPMYDENNEICIPFQNDEETVSIKVYSNENLVVIGENVFKNGDELVIAAKDGKKVKIYPSMHCNNIITVNLVKKGVI